MGFAVGDFAPLSALGRAFPSVLWKTPVFSGGQNGKGRALPVAVGRAVMGRARDGAARSASREDTARVHDAVLARRLPIDPTAARMRGGPQGLKETAGSG